MCMYEHKNNNLKIVICVKAQSWESWETDVIFMWWKMLLQGPNIIIHQSEKVMSSMNEWCLKHHGEVPNSYAKQNSTFQ